VTVVADASLAAAELRLLPEVFMATTDNFARNAFPASKLIGENVVDAKGDHLGKIEDLAIDFEQGRIRFAILSFGGFLGMGEKRFAVPIQTLQRFDDDRLLLNVDRDKLKNAPGIEKDDWSKIDDRAYVTRAYEFYGYKPYWTDVQVR
jgi:sporulation protein YlmC with PRC-barrel domain